VITALHTLVYADDPEAARAFFRDVLRLPGVDTGGGWLIFRTGPSELGVHPASWEGVGGGAERTPQAFDVSLMCDDLAATMAEIQGRGAQLDGPVQEQPWGSTVMVRVPGAGSIMLYQPKYRPPAFGDDATPPA
jgi:catechol 2,3-dioxygenase-like lactoylglutathione lyase family enzyme